MAEETLRAVVTADITQFRTALNEMSRLVQNASQQLQRAFGSTASQGLQTSTQHVQRLTSAIQDMTAQSRRAADGINEVSRAVRTLRQEHQSASRATAETTTGIGSFNTALGSMRTALGSLGLASFGAIVIKLGKDFLETAVALQQLNTALANLSGGQTSGTQILAFLRVEANRVGVEFLSLAQSFQRLQASAQAANVSQEQTNRLFSAFVGAARVMGSSNEQVKRGLIALEQAISKGKLSAEELRQQLGEALPGATAIMARALGVSMQALDDLLKQGRILTDDWLPQFTRQLEKDFAGKVASASKDAISEFARFKNSMTDLGTAIGPALLTPVQLLVRGFNEIVEYMTKAERKARDILRLKKDMEGAGVTSSQVTKGTGGVLLQQRQDVERAGEQIAAIRQQMRRLEQRPGFVEAESMQTLSKSPSLRQIQIEYLRLTERLEAAIQERQAATAKLERLLEQERQMQQDILEQSVPEAALSVSDKLTKEIEKTIDDTIKKLSTIEQRMAHFSGYADRAKQNIIKLPQDITKMINEIAPKYDVDPRYMQALVMAESGGRNVMSPAGAIGPGQLMPKTAERFKVGDIWDPRQNLEGAARYLQYLQQIFRAEEDLARRRQLVTAAYNAGEGAVMKHGGIPPFDETKTHVSRVMSYLGNTGAAQAVELDLVREKISEIKKTMELVNELIQKEKGLHGLIPPELQKQIDRLNDLMKPLREREQILEEQIAGEKLTREEAERTAKEREKLIEEIRKADEAAAKAHGREWHEAYEREMKDAERIQDQILDIRINVAQRSAKEELEEREKTLEKLQKIEQDAAREMEREQKRAQQEMNQFVEGIQRQLSNTFFQIFKGNKDIFEGILDLFLKLLADMAAAAATKTIVIPLITKIFGDGTGGAAGEEGGDFAQISQTLSGAASSGQGSGIYQRALGNLLNTKIYSWGGVSQQQLNANQAAIDYGDVGAYGVTSAAGAGGAYGGGGGGSITAGSAIGGIGSGIATGYAVNRGLTSLGLSGRSRSAGQVANTTISGAVGGAVAGYQMTNTWQGAAVGAVIGLIGGLIAGLTAGMRDRQRFDVTETRAGRFAYDEAIGVRQVTDFSIASAKMQRLDRYTKEMGFEEIPQAVQNLFKNLTGQIRSVDPLLQKAAVEPLNAYADIMADFVTEIDFKGKDQRKQMAEFIEQKLPLHFNRVMEPLIEGLNILGPVAAQFRDTINTLKNTLDELDRQQKALQQSLDAQVTGIEEYTMSQRDILVRRMEQLASIQHSLDGASQQERLNFIPRAQDLIEQIFQLGSSALQDITIQFEQIIQTQRTAMTTLQQQQASFRANLEAQGQSLEEATWTPAQLFMRRRQQLAQLQAQMYAATPQERINMIPRAQQLVGEIFQLGAQESVLGQEGEAVRQLQQEMLSVLYELTRTSDYAFQSEQNTVQHQINLAQQQLDLLRQSTVNSTGLVTLIDQSRGILAQIQGTGATSQDIAGIGSLQQEMTNTLRNLMGISDSAFASLRSDTQAQLTVAERQLDYLAANLTNTANLNNIAGESLTVLGDIRHFLATGQTRQSTYTPPSTPGGTPPPPPAPAPPQSTWGQGGGPYKDRAPGGGTMDANGIIRYADGSTYNTWTGGVTNPNGYSPYDSYQAGTPYVPRTGLAWLHEGEAVIPAALNRNVPIHNMMMGGGMTQTITVNAPVTIHANTGAVHPEQVAMAVSEHIQRQIEFRSRMGQSSLRGRG